MQFLKNDFLLVVTAIIWGLAFTAQRAGMAFVGPFTFNGVRFLLGSLSLVPLLYLGMQTHEKRTDPLPAISRKTIFGTANEGITMLYGGAGGILLFLGSSFQQIGVVYTSAGKAGFITGMYVIIVPFIGAFIGQKAGISRWAGAVMSLAGLYFLSIKGNISINKGDLFVFVSAFFWALHVIVISRFSPLVDTLKLAFYQYLFCGVLSMLTALAMEEVRLGSILQAWLPIFYGGFFSVGVAYTLQVYAQKRVHPAHAAIILSLEGVFAVLGGWLLLSETLSLKGVLGCLLMLCGMLISQAPVIFQKKKHPLSS
ncbi:DMT family transporter [Desulfospira joergensenii]|uniref:DMT family transporter n=1 Tax=Desulfospira joergensenii TaxID=53329 RepID=UPI0003B49C87|nr:DMT family transporter [Desulfospira joergensenii]